MIVIEHASKSFGPTRAVDDLSFALEPGQMTGLLGPNGAGKTTTIRMIAGYLAPDAGSITLAGHPVRTSPAIARRSLGYLPESAPLYPELKPAQYLDYRARLFAMPRRERRAAVARVIDRCRLADMAHKRIGVLSKGYRQRVGLAAAIVHDPPVLILDEPTNGLDPAQMRTTRALIASSPSGAPSCSAPMSSPRSNAPVRASSSSPPARSSPTAPPTGSANARTTAIHLETTPDDPALRARVADALGPRATVAPRPGAPEGWARFAVTPDPAFTGDAQAALARALAGAARPVRHLADAAAPLEERVVELIDRAGATPADEQHPDGSAP
jgi:ABC-2 type transport system ATP-binding protein